MKKSDTFNLLTKDQLDRGGLLLTLLGYNVVVIDNCVFAYTEFNCNDSNTPYIEVIGRDITKLLYTQIQALPNVQTQDDIIGSNYAQRYSAFVQSIDRLPILSRYYSSDYSWMTYISR